MTEIVKSVYLTDQIAELVRQKLSEISHSQLIILVDENTAQQCLPVLEDVLDNPLIIKIPAGEVHKHLGTCEHVWSAMTDANVDRKAFLLNLGGGVVSDLGGFCASTYKRGIRFGNVPTTLLAQVDASVGGKTGVDYGSFKNHIGVFVESEFVLIDPVFLKTLPVREQKSGYAEIIKHALIKSKDLWGQLQEIEIQDITSDLIAQAIRIKADIVERDFKEQNERKLLNFGHSLGHAVEGYLLHDEKRRVLHGEAIAAGMIMESYLAMMKSLLSEGDFKNIRKYIGDIYDFIPIAEFEAQKIIKLLYQDKKNVSGSLRFSLLKNIGEGIFDQEVSEKECLDALNHYIKFAR